MEPDQAPQLTDQHDKWRVLDALPFIFAVCVIVLMLLTMLSAFFGDIYASIVMRF